MAYINVDISVFGMGETGLTGGGRTKGWGRDRAPLGSSRSQRHPEGAGDAAGPKRHLLRRQAGEGGGDGRPGRKVGGGAPGWD